MSDSFGSKTEGAPCPGRDEKDIDLRVPAARLAASIASTLAVL
jgi:hypothetical protein